VLATLRHVRKKGALVNDQGGVGVTSVLTSLPRRWHSRLHRDVTTFHPSDTSITANLDVSLTMTNLRSTCTMTALNDDIQSDIRYRTPADRRSARDDAAIL
jgi:hypothetical protein